MPRRPDGSALRQADVARRAVLGAAGALALSACLPIDEELPPKPDPDLRLRRRVAGQVADLAAAFAAATSRYPELTGTLAPLAAEHDKHITALIGQAAARRSGVSTSASPTTSPPQVPSTSAATVDWLIAQEEQAARRRRTQSLDAGPALARLLASIGACETAHAALLGRAAP